MDTFRRHLAAFRAALARRAGLVRILALVGSGVLMTLVTPNPAEACSFGNLGSCVALIFIKIFQLLTALMGWILVLEVDALIRVSQYHNFVSPGPSAVQIGWIVTRDLANMFFIVILLIIAFGTILGSSTYHYEKNLPRLLIMAVVINFSKTICGLFIDMGQVVMLTFVNGFKEAAGGNFVNAFQINKLLQLADGGGGTYTFSMVVAMMFAFILSAIAVSVVLVMLVIMIFRIVILWVLIILSPIAFLTSAVPKGGDYYAQWWKEFKKYIVTGPVIAFFLWLALASVQKSGGSLTGEADASGKPNFPKSSAASASEAGTASNIGDSKIPTEAGASSDVIMNMIISICLMFAGLKFASESGVIGAGVAKSVRGGFEKTARGIGRWGVGAVTSPVTGAAKSVGGRAMSVVGAGLAKTPFVGRTPLGAVGRRMALKGEQLEEDQRKKREKFYGSSAENLARFTPNALASKTRLRGATAEQKLETMKAAMARPEVLAAMKQSGAAKMLLADGEAIAKKDPSKKAELDAFKKAAWTEIEDPKDRKAVLGKMSGEDARKYVAAEDITSQTLDGLSKAATLDILQNGKAEQKAGVMGAFGDKLVDVPPGGLDRYFKEKGMNWSEVPPEAFEHGALSTTGLKNAAMEAAGRDPSLLKRFAENPNMRDVMAPVAAANLATAVEGPDRAKKRAMAMMLGGDQGPTTPDEAQEMSTLSLKELNELDRNAPIDNREIQEAIDRGVTAALKHGTAEMAQAIMNSPTLSQRVPLTEARAAEPSTPGYSSRLERAAGAQAAELDRQKKGPNPPAGIDQQIADLRTAVQAMKSATKDLSAAEDVVAKSREDYGAAQKAGDVNAMKAFAAAIKSALTNVETKRAAVATANTALKAKT